MKTQADKTKENKSNTVENELAQKQANGASFVQFKDHRPEAIIQRKLQEMANNSHQAQQFKIHQEKVNSSTLGKRMAPMEHKTNEMDTVAFQTKLVSNSEAKSNSKVQMKSAGNPPIQNKGVVQLLGKKGSIALGVAIGTIVPVIGNIIGGYIGYKLWKRKQKQNAQSGIGVHIPAPPEELVAPIERNSPEELEEKRRKLEEEAEDFERRREAYHAQRYGPKRGAPNQKELGALIQNARDAYLAKKYQEVFELLTNRDAALKIGIDLRVTEQAVNISENTDYRKLANGLAVGENMMFFPLESRINLRVPVLFQGSNQLNLFDVPELANLILPMFLEEYVHALQNWTKRHFSKQTDTFAEETGAGRDKEQDMDEVDVMALFHEWGFDIEGIDYVERYKERKDYWEWLKSKRD